MERVKRCQIKILIVDDEPIIIEELSETLTDEGYECISANNVDDALLIIKNTKDIDVVLTDLKMPKKTGADLIAAVEKEFDRQIQFILTSGHACPRIEYNGIDFKKYPFLRKPVCIDDLLEIIATISKSKET